MKQISLSDNEWKLMGRLWERSPRTIMELTADLREETGWSNYSIITLLSGGEAMGGVGHVVGAGAMAYYPCEDRETAARAETESFLGKVYGGSLGLLVSAMVESRALTEEDLAELSAILEKGGEKP